MNVSEAEREIARILRQLEIDTDCVIDTVGIHDVDGTNVNDDRVQFYRTVAIETHRLPGNNWSQAKA